MQKMSIVNVLDPSDHLIHNHQNSFKGELSKCILEQIFE